MNCRKSNRLVTCLCVAALGLFACELANAQGAGRLRTAYNPVSGRTEVDTRYHERLPGRSNRSEEPTYDAPHEGVEQASYCECEDDYCDGGCSPCASSCGCGDGFCAGADCCDAVSLGPCAPRRRWFAGFEATLVKPYFGDNPAFTITDNVGSSTTISEANFDYDLEFTPRVFVGWNRCDNVGLRATWWQFDHAAKTATGNPPSSGLGTISHPEFADVDLSSDTPTNVFSADTTLNAYAIDLEAVKTTDFCAWRFGMSGGFRYAYVEQGYVASLSDNVPDVLGTINYQHSIEGFGPTIAFEAFRPYGCHSGMFCKARGSILFGDAKSRLEADEDLTLTTPSQTIRTTASDDLLSICELQLGYRWHANPATCRGVQPFYSIAMEGQLWDGAGNASSQGGNLGFFGFNSAVGLNW